jgi:hypothetical protein
VKKLTKRERAIIDNLDPRCEDCAHYRDHRGNPMCHAMAPFLAYKETARRRPHGSTMNCGTEGQHFKPNARPHAEERSDDSVQADVGPCPICGDPGCLGNECEPEPEEPDDDLCDQCGQPSGCLLNGLCPMCYETGGGVLHRRSNSVLDRFDPPNTPTAYKEKT